MSALAKILCRFHNFQDLAESERRTAELQASKSRAEAVAESAIQDSDVKTRALNSLKVGFFASPDAII